MPVSVASALLLGMTVPRADIGLNAVTIDCGDGYPIHANVSLAELTKLEGVIQAMAADPVSAPPCSLTQDAQPEQTETRPFIFGSGTYGSPVNCELRFHVKASLDANGDAHGFQRVIAPPDNCGAAPPGGGELTANVTCVAVAGNIGEMRGIVSESTGLFASSIIDIHPGDVMFTQAQENTPPVPDEINQYKDPPNTEHQCVPQIDSVAAFPLDSGDIEVRQ
jgi:hypothetical protein